MLKNAQSNKMTRTELKTEWLKGGLYSG